MDEELNTMLLDIQNEASNESAESQDVEDTVAPVVEKEDDKITIDVEESDSNTETNETKKEVDESTEADNKPWKSKNKISAKDRIAQLTREKYEERRANDEMRLRLEQLEKLVAPKPKGEVKPSDFPDDESFKEYKANQQIQKEVDSRFKKIEDERNYRTEVSKLTNRYKQNLENARADLPDYDESIQYFNTAIPMSQKVRNHLLGSPAGVYTMYRIANDPELNSRLGNIQDSARADAEIAKIHDDIYKTLNKRKAAASKSDNKTQTNTNTFTAPPKTNGTGGKSKRNLMDLDGDEFLVAYNKRNKGN